MPKKPPLDRMHIQGLTLEERKVGAIVATGMGRYRVTSIDKAAGVVLLEPLAPSEKKEKPR